MLEAGTICKLQQAVPFLNAVGCWLGHVSISAVESGRKISSSSKVKIVFTGNKYVGMSGM